MKDIYAQVKDNPLFAGIAFEDFQALFNCLDARVVSYDKNDVILLSGSPVKFVGIVLTGSVKVLREDIDGNTSIVTEVGVSQLFGEALVCAQIPTSPVTVQAALDCQILLMDYGTVFCKSPCSFHLRLIENMVRIIAKKNVHLHQKLEILSKRTSREKLMTFFNFVRGDKARFTIPYNRQELADYLCMNRSALSKELGAMEKDGLIDFHKNEFELL